MIVYYIFAILIFIIILLNILDLYRRVSYINNLVKNNGYMNTAINISLTLIAIVLFEKIRYNLIKNKRMGSYLYNSGKIDINTILLIAIFCGLIYIGIYIDNDAKIPYDSQHITSRRYLIKK
jgi:hypothetical protein